MNSKIMYVCEPCQENNAEACGYTDRNMLRVTSSGTWLCEACWTDDDSGYRQAGTWDEAPQPPEYAPSLPVLPDAEIEALVKHAEDGSKFHGTMGWHVSAQMHDKTAVALRTLLAERAKHAAEIAAAVQAARVEERNQAWSDAAKFYPSHQHFQILVEALSEIKATSDGHSEQPIKAIVEGCLAEIEALPTTDAVERVEAGVTDAMIGKALEAYDAPHNFGYSRVERMREALKAALPTPASAERSYPAGLTEQDHIAHDMRMKRFPKRSDIDTFVAERNNGEV